MLKNVEKVSLYYSPNFDKPKRSRSKIKYIILHYTGMKSEKGAIKRLTSTYSKVSSHYFIKKNGEVINLVPDLYTSWHAGISEWKDDKFLNSKSIGIEISNPGHQNGYDNFPEKQINSLINLLKFLKKKYKIKVRNILGHSDISPNRKKDPGEKFPWKFLSQKKVGHWHSISETKCKNLRNLSSINNFYFYKFLFKFGYRFANKQKDKLNVVKSFQRRFRPNLINGIVDKECFEILKNLIIK